MCFTREGTARLEAVVQEESTFANDKVLIKVATSLTNDSLVDFDLTESLGHKVRRFKSKKEEVKWLPSLYKGNAGDGYWVAETDADSPSDP
jgi:hypothetical protein